ncbi:MarR family winged helix-turn-helix transcriptional regulator [Glycomyces salinus]|uniref:MarR family winged helix-turn-helix transcriptional regulator n=1 Tax=Glycomyces salinus TaxID=980294 RepID=UPI0018EB84C9|nr:MarR family transcriptional regulator [Glycomyces salinus]
MTATDRPDATTDRGFEVSLRLREVSVQLSLLNHQVAGRINLRDVDLYCLDLISRRGPMTPSALARQAGLRPATTTGVLDRLEQARWISRERVPTDRRAVHLTFNDERATEILEHFTPMLDRIDRICADLDDDQLATISQFLTRVTEAGRDATEATA